MSFMETNPKLSIVMPMYGVELYIEKAIKSVINQDFQDWELLVVNDGSLDKSREIAVSLASTDNRIKVLDKVNGGLSDARNFGLNQCRGEYVHFFDSDDWIEQDFYSNLLNEVYEYDLIICGYKVDNEIKSIERIGYKGELSDVVDNSSYHFVSTYLNFAWNKLFRRSFLVKNSLYYEKGLYRIEDAEFMMRFMNCAPKVKLVEYTGYHYMVRNTTTLSTVFDYEIIDHAARSVEIHSQTLKLISENNHLIMAELGKMNFLAIKSVLYRMKKNIPPYKILQLKLLIERIINNNSLCKYLYLYLPSSTLEKIFIRAIVNKRSWILVLFYLLKK